MKVSPMQTEIREGSPGWLLQRLARLAERDMESRLEPLGLTVGAFAVLMFVLENPGRSQADCCAAHSMPPWAVSRLLDQLAAAGLVERRAVPQSRRAFAIHPSPAALDLRPRLLDCIRAANARLLAPLEPTEAAAFKDMLARLVGDFSR